LAIRIRESTTRASAYVPDGLTAEEYGRIRKAENDRYQGKNLGRLGPRGFKSRSLQSWQMAFEKGHATHYVAPVGYKKMLRNGSLKLEDVPYMVREGGSWDNSDVPGARRVPWTDKDREYSRGGYTKEQSASIFGSGPGLDWTGTRPRDGDGSRRAFPGFG
jgi:hypothetical protein